MPSHARFQHRLRPRIGGRGGEIDFEEVPSYRGSTLKSLGRNFRPRRWLQDRLGTRGAVNTRRAALLPRPVRRQGVLHSMTKAAAAGRDPAPLRPTDAGLPPLSNVAIALGSVMSKRDMGRGPAEQNEPVT